MDYQPRRQTLTFVGLDGYAGFRRGTSSEVQYTYLEGDKVSIELAHAPGKEPVVIERVRFDEWWVVRK